MTMFKKVFGSQIAATEDQQEPALPPDPVLPAAERVEEEPIARRPRSQPLFAPVPQVLQVKEEENAARRAEREEALQERMFQKHPASPSPVAEHKPAVNAAPVVVEQEASPPPVAPAPTSRPVGRARTRLLGFGSSPDVAIDPMAAAPVSTETKQFPTGWIVVVGGPGRGHYFPLFNGVSTIGRDEEQTIALSFGDMTISRENHAAIAYDEEDNKFYVGHGGKSNIIRLNGRPVLSTETLVHGDKLRIGETVLRFVAFCDADFNWMAAQDD